MSQNYFINNFVVIVLDIMSKLSFLLMLLFMGYMS